MTALLQIQDLSFSRGSLTLFDNISLTLGTGDRVGLVGHNGSGKSSLMSLITGAEDPDAGEIRTPRGLQLALVEQFVPETLLNLTLEDAMLDVLPTERRPDERYRVDTLLQQLSFQPDQWRLPVNVLSGGEQNLVLFARAILNEPELLLMDEPGNHMDVVALTLLQQFLINDFKQPFLVISHDRELLDICCNRTVFLRDRQLYSFDLPYESAREALADQDEQAAHHRETQQKEIKRVETSAKRLAQWGRDFDNEDLARKAKSMQRRVEKLKQEQTTLSKGSGLDLQLQTENIRAKSVLTLENLTISTPDNQRQLLTCEFQHVKPGDRIALLGKNGIGKSTTLNLLLAACSASISNPANDTINNEDINSYNDTSQALMDSIRFNPNTRLGFYDQKLAQFETAQSRFDWLRNRSEGPDDRVKQVLLQSGIPFADFDRAVNTLSGGECARLMFMLFQLNQPNFLILDEPTNHIDVEGREQLEQQLIESGATLLITSHDRRFLERIANRWWWINDGLLQEQHDLEEFYHALSHQGMTQNKQTHERPNQEKSLSSLETDQMDSEEQMLERIDQLETLLKQDQARKIKFQKPDRQIQWQAEIDTLWAKVTKSIESG